MPSPFARLLMLTSFRLFMTAGVLVLSTTQSSAVGAQVRTDTTLTLDASATVEITARSSDIIVRGGSDRQLRLRNDGDGRVDVRGGSRALLIDAGENRGRGSTGALDLVVPRGTAILVRTNNGDVAVHGVGADVEVRSTSGDITVEDAARVRIETVAGDITVRNVQDGIRINATSGDVQIDGVRGDVEVSGTSTSVELRDVDSRRVDVTVVSGDVQWSGAFAADGRYAFNAHSGDLDFVVPRDTRATLDVRTFNGDFTTSDLPLTLMPDPAAAVRDRERERNRDRISAMRDSVERMIEDSMRRDDRPRTRRDSQSFERDFERSVERLVESVMRGVSRGMESLAESIDGVNARDRARRFTLGRDGGPLVTISTFNGDVRFGTPDANR